MSSYLQKSRAHSPQPYRNHGSTSVLNFRYDTTRSAFRCSWCAHFSYETRMEPSPHLLGCAIALLMWCHLLDASSHLYERSCPSVGWSVRWSVRQSVTLLSNSMKNGLLRILSNLDSAGRGRKRHEEEGATRGVKKMKNLKK